MASAPKTSAASARPQAMAAASSLTRCWGAWPPLTSRIARAGAAPTRPAGRVGAGIGERGPGGVRGQVDRRTPLVARLAEALGGLSHADQHGGALVEVTEAGRRHLVRFHGRTSE
jgi:hypothetical protein